MCGAESAGRLVNVAPPTVALTTTGTSPAPASDEGSSTMIWSKPGVSDGPVEMTLKAVVVVLPTVTVTVAVCPGGGRRPVNMMSRRVGAVSVSVEGASVSVERMIPSSPVERPVTVNGVGEGDGDAAATGMLLAPVENATGAGEAAGVGLGAGVSLVTAGANM